MKGMVVVFTSNKEGGVLQFAVQMRKIFEKICKKCFLFVPEDCNLNGEYIKFYKRHNSILPFDKQYYEIARQIEKLNPEFVFACESQLMSSRIVKCLSLKTDCYMCIHDVKLHPSYKNVKLFLKQKVKTPFIKRAWKACKGMVLLSENTLEEFMCIYPQYSKKCNVIPLGAHVPEAVATMPKEMIDIKDYILFFGRIDKYKGLLTLLEAYHGIMVEKPSLVIAGKGKILEEEQKLIEIEKIKVLNRFIEDGEMIALFINCKCVVLPYTEASQSGVLAMAYYFGKPVIVSDLPGLKEFVINGKTGYIFRDMIELQEAIVNISVLNKEAEENVLRYYNENMEWEKNIKKWITALGDR